MEQRRVSLFMLWYINKILKLPVDPDYNHVKFFAGISKVNLCVKSCLWRSICVPTSMETSFRGDWFSGTLLWILKSSFPHFMLWSLRVIFLFWILKSSFVQFLTILLQLSWKISFKYDELAFYIVSRCSWCIGWLRGLIPLFSRSK